MKTMTLRGIDPDLAARLKQEAEESGKSVNQTAIDALRQQLGLGGSRRGARIHTDMDHLFGQWRQEEFDQFQEELNSMRTIDEELWR